MLSITCRRALQDVDTAALVDGRGSPVTPQHHARLAPWADVFITGTLPAPSLLLQFLTQPGNFSSFTTQFVYSKLVLGWPKSSFVFFFYCKLAVVALSCL